MTKYSAAGLKSAIKEKAINLTKAVNWQETDYYNVRAEQTIKVVETYTDGTEVTTIGITDHFDHFGVNGWVSKTNRALLKRNLNSFVQKREIFVKAKTQEEKDAEFVFPTGVGAVVSVESKPSRNGSASSFVFNGKEWTAGNVVCPRRRIESEIRDLYQKFEILSEGVNV